MAELPTPSMARELLSYNPETGELCWLQRSEKHFTATPHRTALQQANWWNSRNAGKQAFTAVNPDGYHCGIILRKSMSAHRLIWAIYFGEWPSEIDHINGVRTDNRIANLREVSRSENCRNRGLIITNQSGVRGVHHLKTGRWTAAINDRCNTRKHLGTFDSFAEAAQARLNAEKELGYPELNGRRACKL